MHPARSLRLPRDLRASRSRCRGSFRTTFGTTVRNPLRSQLRIRSRSRVPRRPPSSPRWSQPLVCLPRTSRVPVWGALPCDQCRSEAPSGSPYRWADFHSLTCSRGPIKCLPGGRRSHSGMKPEAGSTSDYPGEVLAALATGLAADTVESGRKTLEVVRARSPELVHLSEDTGEDLVATSAGFIDMLLASLRSDLELPWAEYDERSRSYGRLRAVQGVPLESLIDVVAVYRRATIELISLPLRDSPRRDEIVALAQSRLENVAEWLTMSIARGYIDYLEAEHRARENEMFGLAAIVSAMGRSLDIT